jgi:response regulator RpfG family c-di-GMP phosphodiesterase
MIQMAEMRDPKETGAHVNRVGSYAVVLYETWARRRDIDPVTLERQRDRLRMAAMLHDVGKVAIPDHILKKPGRFTEEEFLTMQQHTLHGARLFLNPLSDFDHAAAEVALTHHERWDGKGYPGYVDPATGLPLPDKTDDQGSALPRKGEEIPLFGRIVALADVYDALSHQRVYKEAWEEERVLGLIRDGSGTQFDPELVEIFFECLDTFQQISLRFP